jgi:hypothetical protein
LIAATLLITVLAFTVGIFQTIAAVYTIILSCPVTLLLFGCWPELLHLNQFLLIALTGTVHMILCLPELLSLALSGLIALGLPELIALALPDLVALPG